MNKIFRIPFAIVACSIISGTALGKELKTYQMKAKKQFDERIPEVLKLFEQRCGYKVKAVSDVGTMIQEWHDHNKDGGEGPCKEMLEGVYALCTDPNDGDIYKKQLKKHLSKVVCRYDGPVKGQDIRLNDSDFTFKNKTLTVKMPKGGISGDILEATRSFLRKKLSSM